MSEARHTPGPWKFGWEDHAHKWAIVTNGAGSIIANVNTETGPDAISAPATRKMPAAANARLISAAPDTLQALERLLRWVREPWADDDSPENESVIYEAEAAIAKATP